MSQQHRDASQTMKVYNNDQCQPVAGRGIIQSETLGELIP